MSTKRQLVVATNNTHKLAEISAMLGPSWLVRSAQEVAPGISWDETGTSFIENARIKAKALKAFTSDCVLADDSGLCVDALKGAPGVWSSSYGGREGDHVANNRRLIQDMKDVPTEKRSAYFICVLLLIDERGEEHVFEGRCLGAIAKDYSGGGGFGYDPLFYLPERGVTMGSLREDEKNQISHRGRAMQKFLQAMKKCTLGT